MTRNIKTNADYKQVMVRIDRVMAKGSKGVSAEDLNEIRNLAESAQAYEQTKYIIEAPTTLIGMIEMRMYEMKLKQRELAEKLDVSDAKLSLIMNGKQKPGISFLKALYTQLNIDAEFILEHA